MLCAFLSRWLLQLPVVLTEILQVAWQGTLKRGMLTVEEIEIIVKDAECYKAEDEEF